VLFQGLGLLHEQEVRKSHYPASPGVEKFRTHGMCVPQKVSLLV
jgi:hypothetical protein